MKKLLIAFDGSAGAELAIKDLARAGLSAQCVARVISVADLWIPTMESDRVPTPMSLAAAQAKASEMVRETGKTAIQGAQLLHSLFPNWTISTTAVADSPAWGILSEARNWQPDVVILGSYGRTLLQKAFLGSVSQKVAAEAICSVRIARARPHPAFHAPRVLVGIDGSGDSLAALEDVLERPLGAQAEIHIVTVADARLESELAPHWAEEPERGLRYVEKWVNSRFAHLAPRLAEREMKLHIHISEGDPKSTLLQIAHDLEADCIFLGARGLHHRDRQYLGTLASAVCARAHCSVEICRHPLIKT